MKESESYRALSGLTSSEFFFSGLRPEVVYFTLSGLYD